MSMGKIKPMNPVLVPLTKTEAADLVDFLKNIPEVQLKVRRLLLERDQLRKRLGPPHSAVPEFNTGCFL
jgi:hypothetical protein